MGRTIHIAVLSFIWVIFPLNTLLSQNALRRKVSFACYDCTPSEALVRLSRETSININYGEQLFAGCSTVRVKCTQQSLEAIIRQITSCTPIIFHVQADAVTLTKKTIYHNISGFITDKASGERLIGASIRVMGSKSIGVISNEFGFFSLRLEAGEHVVGVSYIGYKSEILPLHLSADKTLKIGLKNIDKLPEVVVLAPLAGDRGDPNHQQMSSSTLPRDRLHALPMPGGESDLLRQAALEPGVQSGVDGLGGLHVRGGNADQNLILLDDVPVYNPGHALGLFSVFNPATVSSSRLWKGNFPARYGGRISSVLDVRTRDGDQNDYHAEASFGVFATSLTAEGPVLRGKSAFLVSVRATYFDPWIQLLSKRGNLLINRGDQPNYRFYDANLKLNYTFSDRDRVYLSYYNGSDNFYNVFRQSYYINQRVIEERIGIDSDWGNTIAALRWNHVIRGNFFANTTLRYSRFLYQSRQTFRAEEFGPKPVIRSDFAQLYQSYIRDGSAKTDFTWYQSARATWHFGGAYTLHDFRPGTLSVNLRQTGATSADLDSLITAVLNDDQPFADEGEIYADADFQFTPGWQLNAGINANFFQTGTAKYRLLQPRILLRHHFKNNWKQWIGAQRMAQNLHQIGSYSISLPFELWVPSTAKVLPETARQVNVGTSWSNKAWGWQAEAYYKKFDRTLAFLSFSNPIATGFTEESGAWEDRVTAGTGQAKGVEISIEKFGKNLNGSLAYTLSKATRQFPELNSGRVFPFRFDRRHDLKIQIQQKFRKQFDFNVIWVCSSGNPITLAAVKYRHQSVNDNIEREVNAYSSVNGYRLPNYHRLDISANYHFYSKKAQHFVQLGVYNAYNRANPFHVFVNSNTDTPGQGIQYTLLPILPIFKYEVKF